MSGGEWFSEAISLGLTDEWKAELEEAKNACNGLTADVDDVMEYTGARLNEAKDDLGTMLVDYGKKMQDAIMGTEAELKKSMLKLGASIKMVLVRSYAMLTQLLSVAGITIDPVFNAIIHLLFTTWEQYLVLATVHTTSQNYIGAGLAIASAAISVAAAVQTQQEQQRSRAEMQAQRAEMDRAQSLGFSITFISD